MPLKISIGVNGLHLNHFQSKNAIKYLAYNCFALRSILNVHNNTETLYDIILLHLTSCEYLYRGFPHLRSQANAE